MLGVLLNKVRRGEYRRKQWGVKLSLTREWPKGSSTQKSKEKSAQQKEKEMKKWGKKKKRRWEKEKVKKDEWEKPEKAKPGLFYFVERSIGMFLTQIPGLLSYVILCNLPPKILNAQNDFVICLK